MEIYYLPLLLCMSPPCPGIYQNDFKPGQFGLIIGYPSVGSDVYLTTAHLAQVTSIGYLIILLFHYDFERVIECIIPIFWIRS